MVKRRRLRQLERQFRRRTVDRIRAIQARLDSLSTTHSVLRYFIVEAQRTLEGGLLLPALLVVTTLLELRVRLAVLDHRLLGMSGKRRKTSAGKILREIEEDRSFGFAKMLDELHKAKIITNVDKNRLTNLYKSTRIPLHHAITGRFIRDRAEQENLVLLDDIGGRSGSHKFELVVEDYALPELEKTCDAIELLNRKVAAQHLLAFFFQALEKDGSQNYQKSH